MHRTMCPERSAVACVCSWGLAVGGVLESAGGLPGPQEGVYVGCPICGILSGSGVHCASMLCVSCACSLCVWAAVRVAIRGVGLLCICVFGARVVCLYCMYVCGFQTSGKTPALPQASLSSKGPRALSLAALQQA